MAAPKDTLGHGDHVLVTMILPSPAYITARDRQSLLTKLEELLRQPLYGIHSQVPRDLGCSSMYFSRLHSKTVQIKQGTFQDHIRLNKTH